MRRRDFLRLSGTFFATASLTGLPACGDDGGTSPDGGVTEGTFTFPQGLASGDPRPDSVVLWTRVEAADGGTGPVTLLAEVATDAAFTDVVVSQELTATTDSDHTVRLVVDGLAAGTAYHYRFTAGLDTIAGRTRTAPAADADVAVRLAWVSCQDYAAGTYAAYRQLIEEDDARDEADRIQFVLHLGDFIYETRGDGFQTAIDENFEPVSIENPDGSPRGVPAFPDGGTAGSSQFAQSVDDYRHLYKTFLSDPDLQAARARWPFVQTWDDHEFTNDSWQSMANYTNDGDLDEPSQARKHNANQAWFEYIPVHLSGATGVSGVTQHAADFEAADVEDAPFTAPNADNFVPEPNNVAAVGSMTIYRSLRWGRHVELVITDERSYRSDHAVPEEFTEDSASAFMYFDPRNALPAEHVYIMDAGNQANGGSPPATVGGSPNPRRDSPPGTMLGATQREWFLATMTGSDATWKVWGNEVPLMRFFIAQQPVGELIADRLMAGDAWDGYPWERRQILTALRTAGVENLLVLTGDIHAHFAGVVMDDFEAAKPTPIGAEFCAAGIASNSLFSFFEDASGGSGIPPSVRALITYDASGNGGPRFRENMNLLLLHGTSAADTMAETDDREAALAAAEVRNPHLKYADTNAQGYGVVRIDGQQAVVTLTTMERPLTRDVGVRRTATFTVPAGNPGGMTGPEFTGTPPFPFA